VPSPLAHLAAGAGIAALATRAGDPRRGSVFAAAMAISLLPDLDVLPGLVFGDLSAWHNQASHGLVVASAMAGLAAVALKTRFRDRSWRWAAAVAGAGLGMHLLMDWFSYGRGLMLFWPFSEARYSAPLTIFYGVRHSEGLASVHHLATLANELAWIAAAWAVWSFASRRRLQPNPPSH
jgi:membrane-bound metal-dependent hydrolase YbcI (DUF457 family)